VIYYLKSRNHIAQLYNLFDMINYDKGKAISQKEYFGEYLFVRLGVNLVL